MIKEQATRTQQQYNHPQQIPYSRQIPVQPVHIYGTAAPPQMTMAAPTQMTHYANAPAFMPANFNQNEVGQQPQFGNYNIQAQAFVPASHVQQYTQSAMYQQQPRIQHHYVVPVQPHGGYHQPSIYQAGPQHASQPMRMYQPNTQHMQHMAPRMPIQQQPQLASVPNVLQQQQQQQQQQKKGGAKIKITDPNTGRDINMDDLKSKKAEPDASHSPVKVTAPPEADRTKQANADFAAMVLKKKDKPVLKPAETDNNVVPQKIETKPENKKITGLVEEKIEIKKEDVKQQPAAPVEKPKAAEPKPEMVKPEPKPAEDKKTEVVEKLVPAPAAEVVVEAVPEPIVEAKVEAVAPEKDAVDCAVVKEDAVEPAVDTKSVEEEAVKEDLQATSTFTTVPRKKKNQKNRFKEKDKEGGDDMLAAFIDKPPAKEVEQPPEVKPEPPAEEVTWENKDIENEVIKDEDSEEIEALTKKAEASDADTKRQYNRDFLLKFQFASICTSKPENLPNIEIVLNEAHPPTKALVPGQKPNNDFIPQFARGNNGSGKSSSNRGSRNQRGSQSGQNPPKKIVHIPQFLEKVELHKAENKWTPKSENATVMTPEERELKDLEKCVRGILNKLTPQMFKTLLEDMKKVLINTKKKLELTIDLIFEKAVSEPVFSVAYATMCYVLTGELKQIPDAETNATVSFRQILLNKCQKEFEKDKTEEKQMAEDKCKTFDTKEEKEEWDAELEQRELKSRRRMLGNIRFIGELFKLQMISENIMHNCVIKLLKHENPESEEDQLECLCKLLATIGKALDHEKGKPRVDQYFSQLKKISEKRKISTRIKFAICDILDLRRDKWVPRRVDNKPKTIDQIHKEAKDKELEQEKQRQYEKSRPKERVMQTRQRSSGRDSPRMSNQVSSDGWTNVNVKAAKPAVEPNRFRGFQAGSKKSNADSMTLGPTRTNWSKGASGGGSGSGTPTNDPVEQATTNRFEMLSNSNATPGNFENRRGSSRGSRSSSAKYGNNEDRASLLQAVSSMTGRTASPSRISSERNLPAPAVETPPPSKFTEEEVTQKTKPIIDEYLNIKDLTEVIECVKDLESPSLHYAFLGETISLVIDKKSKERRDIGFLLHKLLTKKFTTVDEVCKGLEIMVQSAPDYAIDIPNLYQYFGETLGPIVYDGTLPLNRVKDTIEPLVSLKKAGDVMAEALSVAVQVAEQEETVKELWNKSNVKWEMLLHSDQDIAKFVKDKKLDFLNAKSLQADLMELLQKPDSNNSIFEYIEKNVTNKDGAFIKQLAELVSNRTLTNKGKKYECDKEQLLYRLNILKKYVTDDKRLQLDVLFGIQHLLTSLEHPSGVAKTIFEELYHMDIVPEEVIYDWAETKECPDGKGSMLNSLKGFLDYLRNAEEDVSTS